MSVVSNSVAARWIAGSRIAHAVAAAPDASDVLRGSVVFGVVTRSATSVGVMGAALALGAGVVALTAAALPAFIVVLAFAAPRAATVLLPAAFVLSWRLALGATADETVFVRASDMLTAGALLRCVTGADTQVRARLRELGAYGPVLTAALLMLLALCLSALAGWTQGTLATPQAALLYALQWGALCGAGLLAWVYAPALGHAGLLAWAAAIAAAAGFGLAEWAAPLESSVRYRAFERLWLDGQANHYGGLFAWAACVGAGLALQRPDRMLGTALFLLSLGGLYTTQSRASVVALAAGLALLALWRLPKLGWLLPLAPLAVWLLPWDTLSHAAAEGTSLHDRLVAWKSAMSTVSAYPLLGLGAGARHRSFYDNHYLMSLSECGLAGAAALVYWQACVARTLARIPGGLAAGMLTGWAALAVHAAGNITFWVTVCMGPAAWLLGYGIAMAPGVERR